MKTAEIKELSTKELVERIEIILIITNNLFDANEQNSRKLNIYIEIFIDLIEKLLGAKKGTIDFAKNLIN